MSKTKTIKMNFLKKTKKQKEILLLDFGRGSVRGIIFESNKKNKILNFQTEKIERFGVFDGKDFEMDVVGKAANKLIENLGGESKIFELPKILGFSPDILKAEILNVSFKRESWKGKITEQEQEEIYKFVLAESETELFEKAGKDAEIFKKKILGQKISGYNVPSVVGIEGEELNFKILIVFSSKNYAEFIRAIKKDLHLESAEIFHSVEALNNLAAISAQIFNKGNYKMFINVGEKNTLICFFKENLESVADFQIGGYDFTKAIAREFNLKEDEAEAIKENFSDGKLSPQVSEKIKETILPVLNLWQENFTQCFKDKMGPFEIAIDPRLFGGASLLPLIKETVFKKAEIFLPENLPLQNKTKIIFSAKDTPSLLLTFCNNFNHKNEKNF